ncbi:disease resistance protein Roq1 isoform X1 [Ziziphus jujuba]|uniref:Disease resistance protein Roq1 isoform X1 n=1 Tax=Ziziphus jujuba TaxID=326968 RepID=A0ABM3I1T2_ZIZJJ|nr:disease resistance protein Roq1 isoform X1 [Ziziphus jujuba]XP_048318856.1 disease resistance protein Roq1-like isoform X1 [Ziziphus jujuba var. spinosa]
MISETCSNSSFSSPWEYDVFLSFKEEDTGKSFTDHLYNALRQKGIFTFRDDDQKLGSLVPSKAIEESRFAIVVFSENYASSTRCLDVLVKIVECKKDLRLEAVFLVLYHMDPTQLIDESGKASFAERLQIFKDNVEKAKKWEAALTEVINLSRFRWDLKDRRESDFVQEIVKDVYEKLCPAIPSGNTDFLVGMACRMEKMDSLLDIGLDDVRTVGIWGMGGIGKTTIAHEVFDRIKDKFQASAFIDIKEEFLGNSTVQLQKHVHQILWNNIEDDTWEDIDYARMNLLRNKMRSRRVLIVLDDVDKLDHIESLVGSWKEQHDWLGPGSRVIVTTRNKHLLRSYGEKYIYQVDKLTDDEALQLLGHEAYQKNRNLNEFKVLYNKVVEYADGQPLALKRLGSFLVRENVDEWSEALVKLKENPIDDLFDTFKVSFDGLDNEDKKIFLDMACFFNGKDRHYVEEILQSQGFHPKIGIQVLIERSLITVVENKLWMPNLLQEFGRDIVAQRAKHTK